ncbi:scavenger receptor cysteine-rich domain-containing group B protein [Phasianus colchicus]|uniref:scavenger receptor cysteine-rich domain-containing group B protein n=1 Tax=Phasianus colchicus TaxID=9054 RepID=UPI00129E8DB0|nr:scavenger receptor cysteine-rich domain-containing group B protein [Phasianus colchicus]
MRERTRDCGEPGVRCVKQLPAQRASALLLRSRQEPQPPRRNKGCREGPAAAPRTAGAVKGGAALLLSTIARRASQGAAEPTASRTGPSRRAADDRSFGSEARERQREALLRRHRKRSDDERSREPAAQRGRALRTKRFLRRLGESAASTARSPASAPPEEPRRTDGAARGAAAQTRSGREGRRRRPKPRGCPISARGARRGGGAGRESEAPPSRAGLEGPRQTRTVCWRSVKMLDSAWHKLDLQQFKASHWGASVVDHPRAGTPQRRDPSDCGALAPIAPLDPEGCRLCQRTEHDPEIYGETCRQDSLCIHENCLYHASGLYQRGADEEGFFGFLFPDIEQELQRVAQKVNRAPSVLAVLAELRLANGPSRCQGRVEILYNGSWGTVCDDDWDIVDANVVCRQLGCGHAIALPAPMTFGQGSGPIFLDNVDCKGQEAALSECWSHGWGIHNCYHYEDVAVVCNELSPTSASEGPTSRTATASVQNGEGDGRIRLVSGADACQGRVEIFYQGSWGTVCDDDWGLSDASVVCKQVGCGQALEYKSNAYFGYGTGHILLDNVNCEGSEPILSACYSLGWGIHNCGHHEDAGVICMGNGARGWDILAQKQPAWPGQEGGSGARVGHATRIAPFPALPSPAIIHCLDTSTITSFTTSTALDYEEILTATATGDFSMGPPWCWLQLRAGAVGAGARHRAPMCPHVSAVTDGHEQPSPATEVVTTVLITAELESGGVRLANGNGSCRGRVEVRHGGTWGTVCDDDWDFPDAQVVCRQLGCGPAVSATVLGSFGYGTGPVLLDNVGCDGHEMRLADCFHLGWGQHNCGHHEDAGVVCRGAWSEHRPSRPSRWAVVGCRTGVWSQEDGVAGPGPGMGSVLHRGCADDSGDHFQEATVATTTSVPTYLEDGFLRLVNGSHRCEGRVEMFYLSQWGTVCDDAWDLRDAKVVCRQLGCGHAVAAWGEARYGPGTGYIFLDNLKCKGSEPSLLRCSHIRWDVHNCDHSEDASVVCILL